MNPPTNWFSKIIFSEPKWKYTVLHSCGVKRRTEQKYFYRYIYKYNWAIYVNILSILAKYSGSRKNEEAVKGLLRDFHTYVLPILKNILFSFEKNFLNSENLSMPCSYSAVMGRCCLMTGYSPFVFLHSLVALSLPTSPLPCPLVPSSPSFPPTLFLPSLSLSSSPFLSGLLSPHSPTSSCPSSGAEKEKIKLKKEKNPFIHLVSNYCDPPSSRIGSKLLCLWSKEFNHSAHPQSAYPLTGRQTTKWDKTCVACYYWYYDRTSHYGIPE